MLDENGVAVQDDAGMKWKEDPECSDGGPWVHLRARWEDQLKVLAPDALQILLHELEPVERMYEDLQSDVDRLRERVSKSGKETREEVSRRVDAEREASRARNEAESLAEQLELSRRNAESLKESLDLAKSDTRIVAESLLNTATMLAKTDPNVKGGWEDIVSDESVAIVKATGVTDEGGV